MTEWGSAMELSEGPSASRDRRSLIGQILAWIPRDDQTGGHCGKRRVYENDLPYDVVVSSPDSHEATIIVVHPNQRVTTYDFSSYQEALTRRVYEPDADMPSPEECIAFGPEYESASEDLRRMLARYALGETE